MLHLAQMKSKALFSPHENKVLTDPSHETHLLSRQHPMLGTYGPMLAFKGETVT